MVEILKRVTTGSYINKLNDIIINGDISLLKDSAKLSRKMALIYFIAIIISSGILSAFESTADFAPLTVIVFGFGLMKEIISMIKSKRKYNSRIKPIRILVDWISNFSHINCSCTDERISFTIENNQHSEEITFQFDKITSFYHGMGKYMQIQQNDDSFILPRGIIKQSEYEFIFNQFMKYFNREVVEVNDNDSSHELIISQTHQTLDRLE